MNRKSIVVLIITLLCLAAASTAIAQGDKPDGSDVAVGATFTYQGQIKRNGALFNGACDMRFTLWDAATGGLQVAAYTPPTQVPVTGGVYTVEVDFGNQFKGEARWIQTEAKCADDTGYTTLPRVALNPTPYAIGLIPGAQVSGNIAGTAGVLRVTNNGAGAALLGLANSSTGATYGVLGNAFSPTGYAVSGYADGGATAVYGYSNAGGAGVVGESIGFEGVRGVAYDVNHGAVVGIHKGGGFGVYGDSTTGAGVVGKSSSWVGVYGESSTQTAVWGKSTNASGVVGSSTGYIGVYGESTNYEGVRGTSHNASHAGVVGVNDAAGGIGGYCIAPHGGFWSPFLGEGGNQGGGPGGERGRRALRTPPQQRRIEAGDTREAALARAKACFAAAAERAAKAGVIYCVEPLAPDATPLINTLEEAAALVNRIGNPALRSMLDCSAAGRSEAEPPSALVERWVPSGMIAHVQVNDRNRRGPGQGEQRFAPLFAALLRNGYPGDVAVEPFDYVPDGPGAAARAVGYIRGILEALAQQ